MNRSSISLTLAVMLLVVMDFKLTGRYIHYMLGLVLFCFMAAHLHANRSYMQGLGKGRWTLARGAALLVNVLLFAACIMTVVSGLFILPPWLSPLPRAPIMHQVHFASAYAMLILSGIHLGFHWDALWPRMKEAMHFRKDREHVFFQGLLVFMIFLGGVFASFQYDVGSRLLLTRMPGVLKTHEAMPYLFAHMAMFGMYTIIGRAIFRRLRQMGTRA